MTKAHLLFCDINQCQAHLFEAKEGSLVETKDIFLSVCKIHLYSRVSLFCDQIVTYDRAIEQTKMHLIVKQNHSF